MLRRILSAATAAVVARRTYDALRQGPSADRWSRMNHRGEPLTLAEGPAVAAGSLAGLLVASPGSRSSSMLAVAGASALGALDDLTGATEVKGLGGHLAALRAGQLTTGTVKLGGLAATGLVAAALARRGRGGVVDAVLAGGVVAGSANLVNLLDLRPGRAAKAFVAASAGPLVSSGPGQGGTFGDVVAGPVGATAAMLVDDLGERAMLGDTGANALGAAWGVGAAGSMSRGGLLATLGVIVALTVASERVSFSEVIDRTPALRRVDQLGRRPAS